MHWLVISLLSWVAHQLVCVVAFKEISLPCAKGCEAVGNCNREFGTCECPFGRTGPSHHACRKKMSPCKVPQTDATHAVCMGDHMQTRTACRGGRMPWPHAPPMWPL